MQKHGIFSRNPALNLLWLAGTFISKISKSSIVGSPAVVELVKQILEEKRGQLTLKNQAVFLHGIVRLEHKKTIFLMEDSFKVQMTLVSDQSQRMQLRLTTKGKGKRKGAAVDEGDVKELSQMINIDAAAVELNDVMNYMKERMLSMESGLMQDEIELGRSVLEDIELFDEPELNVEEALGLGQARLDEPEFLMMDFDENLVMPDIELPQFDEVEKESIPNARETTGPNLIDSLISCLHS